MHNHRSSSHIFFKLLQLMAAVIRHGSGEENAPPFSVDYRRVRSGGPS
jgi:hypothetical protein